MKNEKFNQLLSAIRNEHIDDQVVDKAGDRVWKSIAAAPAADPGSVILRGCEDFQALIPAYLGKNLMPARAMLFEDHAHACVACRHALEHAREGETRGETRRETQKVWQLETRRRTFPAWRWAMAAVSVGVVAFLTFGFLNGMLPGQHPVRATVESVDGSLYAVAGENVRVIPAGYTIRDGEDVRTAKGSKAVVRLLDGSLVEMGERADVSVSRPLRGTTIHLDGGQVIVQAAKQGSGHLYLATDDCLVSVKGTIFSVNHGIKGSRVSVIEGVVRVDYGEHTAELHPGEQTSTTSNVTQVPIQNDIAWSRNSAKYLALLGDFAVLQKQFAAIPGPGLRYSSDLLPYVPDQTVIYAAIPNVSNTLDEASQLFEDRLRQSPALRDWWKQQQTGKGPKLQYVLQQVKNFSSYLGDEVVFAVVARNGSTGATPVILARVTQPGLEGFIQKTARHLRSDLHSDLDSDHVVMQTVRDPSSVTVQPGNPLLVYVSDGFMIASSDPVELQRTAARVRQGGGGSFGETPFYQQIVHSYQQGAEWLFCVDMEQIVGDNVHEGSGSKTMPTGISDVRYLTMEHREVGGKTESHADLTFASERQGVASWLAAPASIGSLEFVSPDASMVTAAVVKNPKNILEDVFKMIGSGDGHFDADLSEFESKTGVNVLNDLAAPLGGEVTMAFDGPVLPTPRWKLILEVYDPATLQATIEKLIESANREESSEGRSVQVTKRQLGSQTYFVIHHTDRNGVDSEIDYTFVDSYLIAAPDIATITRAIQSRQAGYTLPRSSTFQALLPNDGYTNFSAIFYHNIGPVVGPIAEQLKSSGTLTSQQRQSIDALTANSAPGLIYAYGEPNRIVVASNTGFMGFDLGTLLTMGDHGPLMPQMFLSGALGQSSQGQSSQVQSSRPTQ